MKRHALAIGVANGREVTLSQVLAAREERVMEQQRMLTQWRCPVISFVMNIAGPVKDSPLVRRGFSEGIRLLEKALPTEAVLETKLTHNDTGSVGMYAVNLDAGTLKSICIAIEESSSLGRLFDMDVLDVNGQKLDRPNSRSCIVCGAPGKNCAARRAHDVPTLQAVTGQILTDYFAEAIADAAVQSLLEEVSLTPKPGLVDRRNNGSHKDMDLSIFIASAHALRSYYRECFTIGTQMPQNDIFPALREAGLRAEQAMYQATKGVNTHKGAIFTMGILCGSIGALFAADPHFDTGAIFRQAAHICAASLEKELANASGNTAGEQLYLSHGIAGARGEAAKGFPSVQQALGFYHKQITSGAEKNEALLRTLLHLIAFVEDTNLLHRGGPDGAKWAALAAASILPSPTTSQLEALDDAFISKNLSPGGCADLLAAVIFLSRY